MKPRAQFWSPKRGVEPIAKPAERGPAPSVFGFSTSTGRSLLSAIRPEQEDAMYATIRRYSTKTGTTQETLDGLKRRIEEKFVPTIQEIPGFHSYGVLNVGNKELLSINLFEDRQGATESTRKSAEFVQKDPLRDQLSKAEVIEGELLVLREAGVGVR
jgi:hypothetical protein